ncbi:dephospho-CoA kinase [Oceanobacillus damuensis]|uniref:dephospho-CoA kinase n=1 Tax=Oceanobacillus damuensis TaxID=937928 RepID=UPI000836AF39|nr:dephospho-CoA kinase [Oceanobacillus damuensis]
MSLSIGLTGSIASGKSTVSLMFDDFDIPVVDADKIAREVVEPGENAYEQVVENFGKTILREDGTLDRPALGAIIFDDAAKRKLLNSIVHPAVREKMLYQRDAYLEGGAQCVVLDIPLLFESKLTDFVDRTVVVYVDEAVQLKRLMERNHYSEKEALQRIRSQMSLKKKVKLADAVINNNGTKQETYTQLERLLNKWKLV